MANWPDDSTSQPNPELREALERLANCLIRREPAAADPALGAKLDALGEQLDRIEGRLGQPEEKSAAAPQQSPVIAPPVMAAPAGELQQALFGPGLADQPGLAVERQALLDGIVRGVPEACALLGKLLVFRSATGDKMPPLLKDLGEAYYGWQPKTSPGNRPLETALVDWLQRAMQDAGIGNTIELVDPGQRFDATRHNTASRGVEITEVCGWVVLRDNGRVYTKAAVVAQ